MESEGSFGDLLAAFNIDSEDTDIAKATHQYDEAAADTVNAPQTDTQDDTQQPHDQQATGVNDNQSRTNEDDSKPALPTNTDPVKVESDNNISQTSVPITLNSDIAHASIGSLVSVPVPQVTTLVPPVKEITSVSQLPGGAVVLPNLSQNNVVTNQTLVTQPLIQSIQDANNLLANQVTINGQPVDLLNSSGVMGMVNGGVSGVVGTAPVLPQGVVPGLTQPLMNQPLVNPSPTVVNLGAAVPNNVIAVPMTSLLPNELYQPTVVTPDAGITPASIVTPSMVTPSPSPSPSPSPTIPIFVPNSEQSVKRRVSRKGRPTGSTPTVQELLDEKRRNKTKSVALQSQTKPVTAKPPACTIPEEMPLTLSGRRRRPTKRYIEYLASKDESEDDLEVWKTKKASPPKLKSPVLDLDKPLTDQLKTISETATGPSALKITNVQSLAGVPSPSHQKTDKQTQDNVSTSTTPVQNSIQIKQEPMEADDGSASSRISVSRSSTTSEFTDMSHNQPHECSDSKSSEKHVVASDGTVIKKELVENEPPVQSKKKRRHSSSSSSDTVRESKKLQKILPKETEEEPESGDTFVATNKPLDFRKPIRTREEEERIASEAAARAASQALLRVASQTTPDTTKDKAAMRKEDELRMTRLAEQYKKQQAAELEMREAAQKAASEAAARAASLAMARAIVEELEPEIPDQESQRKAEEASRIASEAAARAAAEAAKRAAAEAAKRAVADAAVSEDLHLAEKKREEEARMIASQAASRAAAQAAIRAAMQTESPVDLSIPAKSPALVKQEVTESSQEDLSQIAEQAAARAVLAAQMRTNKYVPILPASSYSKPTHIKQMLRGTSSDLVDLFGKEQVQTVNVAMVEPTNIATVKPTKVALIEPVVQEDREVHKVVTQNKQIITYPKNPSKSLRESLAWRSFQEGVKQGKYKVVQKSEVSVDVDANGRQRTVDSHSLNVINQDMRCPYCLIQMKVKANLIQHISVCLINPQTHDEDYFMSHFALVDKGSESSPRLCSHCTPNATSVKELKSWSNVLCRLCVTKCADPKITVKNQDHYVVTRSGYFVCKHCGIGLDSEADINNHLSQDVKKDKNQTIAKKLMEGKNSLPVSKILSKKENDASFQFRCGQCRLMFASVGRLLVHTSHCNLNQYIKVLERLSLYNCVNCPVACKVVSDDGKPHKCKPTAQYSSTFKKNLQAVRDISVSKESFVCLRCEEILPSNGHLVLHAKQCNHAQYHLLMRYLDQPPYCNKCLMVFTGYKAYAQHRQRCMKIPRQKFLDDYTALSFCEKCHKSVQREETDLMYHDAVCVGLPCTQQKLLFPEGFSITECCTVINSW